LLEGKGGAGKRGNIHHPEQKWWRGGLLRQAAGRAAQKVDFFPNEIYQGFLKKKKANPQGSEGQMAMKGGG